MILCWTSEGCTCGAPASTPAGMHHCVCVVSHGRCRRSSCVFCERDGLTPIPTPEESK